MRNEPTPSHLNLVHTRRVTHYKWSHCCPVSWRITTTICRTADSTRLQQTSGLRSPLQTQHVYSKHQNCASHSASSTSLTCECSVNNSTLRHSQRIKHFAHLRVPLSIPQHAPFTAHQTLHESSTGSYCQQGRRTSASNRRSHPRLNPSKTVDASHHDQLRAVRLFEVLSSSSFTAASRPLCLFLARVFMQRPNAPPQAAVQQFDCKLWPDGCMPSATRNFNSTCTGQSLSPA